jgi:hypothetical protein
MKKHSFIILLLNLYISLITLKQGLIETLYLEAMGKLETACNSNNSHLPNVNKFDPDEQSKFYE